MFLMTPMSWFSACHIGLSEMNPEDERVILKLRVHNL